jgi:uncharacterized protein (TIGR02246 family)
MRMPAPAMTSPEAVVKALFGALDEVDVDTVEALFGADPQGVDELSGGWRRGRAALHEYLATVKSSGMADLRSTVSDLRLDDWGETAIATFVVDQTYSIDGDVRQIHAPTTIVLRREDGAWRIALVHSVPLAELA